MVAIQTVEFSSLMFSINFFICAYGSNWSSNISDTTFLRQSLEEADKCLNNVMICFKEKTHIISLFISENVALPQK